MLVMLWGDVLYSVYVSLPSGDGVMGGTTNTFVVVDRVHTSKFVVWGLGTSSVRSILRITSSGIYRFVLIRLRLNSRHVASGVSTCTMVNPIRTLSSDWIVAVVGTEEGEPNGDDRNNVDGEIPVSSQDDCTIAVAAAVVV